MIRVKKIYIVVIWKLVIDAEFSQYFCENIDSLFKSLRTFIDKKYFAKEKERYLDIPQIF